MNKITIARIATIPFAIVSHLESQLNFFSSNGVDVHVVTSDGRELNKLTLRDNLYLHIVKMARRVSPLSDIISLFKLFLLFRKYRFDIVHSTTPKAGLLTAIAAFLARVPIRLHTFTGQQWVEMKGGLRWVSRASDMIVGKLNTCCYADGINQAKFLVDQGIIDVHRISVIGNGSLSGVNTNKFATNNFSKNEQSKLRSDLGISDTSFIILFIGRITKEKGLIELFLAFNELLNTSIEVDLVLVGPFDQERGGVVSLTIRDIPINKRIHYIGYSDCPEKYMSISNLLCLPSYREGFPTVVLEAASMGVPTVGSNIYGLQDTIVDGVTGVLVPVKDSISLYRAFEKLLNNRELVAKMGLAAKKRCHSRFESTQINKMVLNEYYRLIKTIKTV